MSNDTATVQNYFSRFGRVGILHFVDGVPYLSERAARTQADAMAQREGREVTVTSISRAEAMAGAVPAGADQAATTTTSIPQPDNKDGLAAYTKKYIGKSITPSQRGSSVPRAAKQKEKVKS